jgi:hypothetical protein
MGKVIKVILLIEVIIILGIGGYFLVKPKLSLFREHDSCRANYACGELLVSFSESLSKEEISSFVTKLGLKINIDHGSYYSIGVEQGKEREWAKILSQYPEVRYAELNRVVTLQ